MKITVLLLANLALSLLNLAGSTSGTPVGNAFTYQGRLTDSGGIASGNYDLRVSLHATELGGSPIAALTNASTTVSNGLFTVALDFGASTFAGPARWLEIGVRTNGSSGEFTMLTPRQPVTPAPYALFAGKAAMLAENASQTFTGPVDFAPSIPGSPPFAVGSAVKVNNLHADLFDGLDSTNFLLKSEHCLASIAELKARGGGFVPCVTVLGYYAPGDGGGGNFYWDVSATEATNVGTIFAPNSNPTLGRWKRMVNGALSVKWFGAKGDGTTQDVAAINATLAAAGNGTMRRAVYLPAGSYAIGSTITLPANSLLIGENKHTTKLLLAFNGDMLTMSEGSRLENLYLDGRGASYTNGRGLVIGAEPTGGHQSAFNCVMKDFDGYVIEFVDSRAGSQSSWIDCEIARYHADPVGFPGRYSVKISPTNSTPDAVPRVFIGVESDGTQFIDLGACNDVFISSSFLGGVLFSTNSRGVLITNSRLANQMAINVAGFNHSISGCDIAGTITLSPGTGETTIKGNTYNQTNPVIDHSGNGGRNQIDTPTITYIPTLTSGGSTPPSLGSGQIRGMWSRSGTQIQVSVELTVGTNTTLGTGPIQISIPAPPVNGQIQAHVGSGYCRKADGSSVNLVVALASPGVPYVVAQLAGAVGQVTSTQPWIWADGDFLRLSITYSL